LFVHMAIDYVVYYAEKLKRNPDIFVQQKELIESQMQSSAAFFSGLFGKDFKAEARAYLREVGLL